MSKVVADISMSLDGFVTGPSPDESHGLGLGGEGLHTWALAGDEVDRDVLDSAVRATGVVVMGRRTFDIVDGPHGWSGDRGYGGDQDQSTAPPVLVVTHAVPSAVRLGHLFSFELDGLVAALERGREVAAGAEVVIMGGGDVINQAIELGEVEELRLHLAPVVLGGGSRLFAGVRPQEWAQVDVRASAHATHLTLRPIRRE